MKTSTLFLSFALVTAVTRAGSVEDVIIKAMRLAECSNYTWLTTVSDDTSTYSLEGRTQTAGFTWLKMPAPPAVAEALGVADDRYLEVLYANRHTFVLRAAHGWVAMTELAWDKPRPGFDSFALARGRPAGRMGTLGAPLPAHLSGRAGRRESSQLRLPGDIHLGLTPPHEELGIVVSSYTDLQVQPEFASGKLSELGAALLLIRDGQTDAIPVTANGLFRLWFKEGAVIRYQLRLEGVIAMGQKTIPVRSYSTTEIKEVGSTRFTVPEDARWKLTP